MRRLINTLKLKITLYTYILLFLSILSIHLKAQDNIRGGLKGNILDQDGQPLLGVSIMLEPDLHQTQTDKNGTFRFQNIIAGNYTIKINNLGYQAYSTTIKIEIDKEINLTVELKKSKTYLEAVEVQGKKPAVDNLLNIERSAMPVTVIGKETIAQMGSRRLDEVLKEQTGVAIVNDVGGGARATGLQMQGFGSDYVMILIDGQPMVGRNSGSFDLSRISVSNIERIEIIKGASSCLFGSEALGGAINIVTRHGAFQPQGLVSLRYGSLKIFDATLEGETPFHHQRGSINISTNYYRTDGFNTDPHFMKGKTAPPYEDYTFQGRIRYRLTQNSTLGASARYALRKSDMKQTFGKGNSTNTATDNQDITDINVSLTYDKNFTNGLRSMSRYYLTRYKSDMSILWQQSAGQNSSEKFIQDLHRLEQQFAYSAAYNIKLTAGIGGSFEEMNNRDFQVPGGLWSSFGYVQADWRINNRFDAVGGIRYDRHNNFGGKLNPSIALNYTISPSLSAKIALGSGFKTPDYRQRYQVFMNPVENYLVIGSEVLRQTLDDMKEAGQTSEIKEHLVNQLDHNLEAEKSLSFNGGFTIVPNTKLKIDINAYYHNISNQINSIRVATGTTIRDIYTYQNLPRSFNTGIEASATTTPLKNLNINIGYQYLVAKDKGVMDSIRNGSGAYASIRDNATGLFRKSTLPDYFGLENRSRHMANLRISYSYTPWDINASIRINYRSKYGFSDSNNNRFLDRYDTFVKQHYLMNVSMEKKLLQQRLSLQLTADNIMGYTDRLIPGQPGRILLLGIGYRFY